MTTRCWSCISCFLSTFLSSAACCTLVWCCLLICVSLAQLSGAAGAAVVSDAELLLQFKAGIVEGGTGALSAVLAKTWSLQQQQQQQQQAGGGSTSGTCPQGWYGVTFSNEYCYVVALSLPNLSLSGEIRASTLGNLSQLTSLSLAQNSLTGSLPDDLGALSLLQSLDLSNNSFSGVVPQSFASLQSLVNLSLANNLLSGSIVDSGVLELPQLVSLNLSGNAFTGGLYFSVDLVRQAKLLTLDLSKNQLSGAINPLLAELPSLTSLNLASNAFSGSIPPQFGECQSLVALDLSNNALSGPIPTMDFMEALASLKLGGNELTGAVPDQFLDDLAPLLQELDLSNNKLSGECSLQGLGLSPHELAVLLLVIS